MTLHVLLPADIELCSRIERFACTLDQVLFSSAVMDAETGQVHLYLGISRDVDLGTLKIIEIEVANRAGPRIRQTTFLRGHSGELDGRSESTKQAPVS